MTNQVKAIPDGYHCITPSIVVKDAKKAIDFYKKALNAKQNFVMEQNGKVMHAEMQIQDSVFMLMDEMPDMGARSAQTLKGSPVSLWIYTKDCDALFNQAIKAGATVRMPVENMFWGDRVGAVIDPFGLQWSIATHIEDVSTEEAKRRGEEFFAKNATCADKS